MNIVDTIIILVLGSFFVLGLARGLIRQLGSVVGFFVSLWVAGTYYDDVGKYLLPSLKQFPQFIAGHLANIAGYFIAFYAVGFIWSIAISLIDRMFNFVARVPLLRTTNRLGGALIGLAEGLLLLSVTISLFQVFPVSKKISEGLKESKLTPTIEKVSLLIKPFIPDASGLEQQFLQQFNQLKGGNTQKGTSEQSPSSFNMNDLDLSKLKINEKDLPPELQQFLKDFQTQQKEK